MSLTHQFLITLTLPLAFIALFLYDLRLRRSRQYGPYWLLTLFVAALWASSLLSYYGGVALPAEVAASWRVAGRHLLTLLGSCVLLTTMAYLDTPRATRRLLFGIVALFWTVSLLLDPAIWPHGLSGWPGNTSPEAQFNLWAAVWVTAWLLPMLAAILLTRQAERVVLSALYRNRLFYWLATLLLYTIGGALALVQHPGQPAWQELGGLSMVLAAVLGATTFARNSLSNFKLALKHLFARLATSLLILFLTWLLLVVYMNNTPSQGQHATVLELGLAAALFTALFGAVNRYLPQLIRRLLLPHGQNSSGALADQPALAIALGDPAALSEVLLRVTQFHTSTENAHLLLLEEQDSETVCLLPLAHVGYAQEPQPMQLVATSAFLAHLRLRPAVPLSTYELKTLPAFSDMSTAEKERLQHGNIEMFMPLAAGEELVGVLALGAKFTGESYDHADLAWLQDISVYGGLLLWQAKEMQKFSLRLLTAQADLNERQRETRRQQELLELHERFAHLISPALREPFGNINRTIESLQKYDDGNGAASAVSSLNEQLAQLRLLLNNIVVCAARIRRQHDLSFTRVDMAEVVSEAVRDLQTMASARRVTVHVRAETQFPIVEGDQQRLYEAVQHLLHNAIRFNKIGGCVDVEYGASGKQLYVHVRDDGIGIADERLEQLWQGAAMIPGEPHRHTSSGLGLVLTRFIVRAHGGRIEARSVPGVGSTFSFYLPLSASESIDLLTA